MLKLLTDWLYALPLTILLLGTGLYFTLRTGFVQLRGIPKGIRALYRGGNLRAMLLSTGGRIGTGNIAGVSAAITVGGPGAVFWMWIMALIGGATAFAESVLAQRYRKDGTGGAAYYMRSGVGSTAMAVVFTLALTACFGGAMNGLQAYQLRSTLDAYGISPLPVAVALTLLLALCLRRDAVVRWSEVLVPIMTVGFLMLTAAVVILRWDAIPSVFDSIFREAFSAECFRGGLSGSAVSIGIRRGLFTNEAGMGSAPQAAASADCAHPAEQGMAQVFSVFIDTLLLCTATVLMLLLPGLSPVGYSEVGWVQASVTVVLGPWAAHLITAAVVIFAFTSILAACFYTRQALRLLLPPRRAAVVAAVLCMGTSFAGCLAGAAVVWNLTDLCMAAMTLLNFCAIWRLRHEVTDSLRTWR